MKKWIIVSSIIVALAIIAIVYEIWRNTSPVNLTSYSTIDSVKIEANPWQPYLSIPIDDTENVYEVIWSQKYGSARICYCKAIFINEKMRQYKMIAPWRAGIIVEYANTNDIAFNKVSKEKMGDQ